MRLSGRYFFAYDLVPVTIPPFRSSGFARTSLLIALIGLGAAGAAAGGYAWREREMRSEVAELGHVRAMRDRLVVERDALQDGSAVLERRVGALAAELELERAGRLEAVASVKALQAELLGAREQLSFYRTIVPGDDTLDLGVQEFRISRVAEGYQFRAILTRKGAGTETLSGRLSLQVTGTHAATRARLAHDELTGGDKAGLAFRMKHFTRLEGALALPKGFEPARVRLSIRVSGENAGRVQRVFSWEQAVGAAG